MGEVRLSPPLSVLSIISLSLGALAWNSTQVPDTAEACKAALDFARHEVKRYSDYGIDVFADPPLMNQLTVEELADRIKETPQGKINPRTPYLVLFRRSIAEIRRGPFEECVDLRAYADQIKIRYDRDASAEALDFKRAKQKSPKGPIYVFSFKLPVVSADGQQAIVESTFSSAVYASGETYVLIKDPAGHWQVGDFIHSWVT